MSEMVERVAKAIHAADPLGSGYRGGWPAYVTTARAAIEAMRDPTQKMLDEAFYAALAEDAKEVWREMTDEALK